MRQHQEHSMSALPRTLLGLWPYFAMVGLFSGVINLLYLSSPLYLMQVYNRVLVSNSVSTLVMLTMILAAALATMAALDAVRAYVLIRCGVILDKALSGCVLQALLARSATQGFSKGAQQLRELDEFRTFITGPGIYFVFDVPWIPLYLTLLFLINPMLGFVATSGAVLLLALAFINELMTREPLERAEGSGQKSYVFADNTLRHADVVVAMGMQQAIEQHWRTSRRRMMEDQAYASDRNAVLSSLIRFFRLLLQSFMLGAGAWLAISHDIMPATIFAASIVLGRALVPVEQGVAAWKQFAGARQAYIHVRNALAELPPGPPRTVLPRSHNRLEGERIEFSLPSRKAPVLRDLSFSFEEGQAVGIVGPSGSGKSTLAKLLIGAIKPSVGTLRFSGIDYAHWDVEMFGREVGYLPQDVGLFAGTVRDNIARFGDASTGDIIDAAKLAGIHDMILCLGDQYDTTLGPGGVGLSGGQRQRLGLARALLGRPPLLVLDEPNANLDGAGEAALAAVLRTLKQQGTTIVVITHRTTILQVVDAMMVIRDGLLDMFGPPQAVYDHLERSAKLGGVATSQ